MVRSRKLRNHCELCIVYKEVRLRMNWLNSVLLQIEKRWWFGALPLSCIEERTTYRSCLFSLFFLIMFQWEKNPRVGIKRRLMSKMVLTKQRNFLKLYFSWVLPVLKYIYINKKNNWRIKNEKGWRVEFPFLENNKKLVYCF